MHRTQSQQKRRMGATSLSNGVSHMSRRANKRIYCRLQLWIWRKWREKCHLGIFGAKKRFSFGSGPSPSLKRRKNKRKCSAYHTQNADNSPVIASAFLSSLGRDAGGSEDAIRRQNCLQKLSESEALIPSNCHQNEDMERNVAAGTDGQSIPRESLVQFSEIKDPLRHCQSGKPLLNTDSNTCEGIRPSGAPRTGPPQRLQFDGPSKQTTVTPSQDQSKDTDGDERISRKTTPPQADVGLNALAEEIHGMYIVNFWCPSFFHEAVGMTVFLFFSRIS